MRREVVTCDGCGRRKPQGEQWLTPVIAIEHSVSLGHMDVHDTRQDIRCRADCCSDDCARRALGEFLVGAEFFAEVSA